MGLIAKLDVAAALNVAAVCAALAFMGAIVAGFVGIPAGSRGWLPITKSELESRLPPDEVQLVDHSRHGFNSLDGKSLDTKPPGRLRAVTKGGCVMGICGCSSAAATTHGSSASSRCALGD